MNRQKLKQADKLLHLAMLREDLANRAVAAARHMVARRVQERDESVRAAQALADEQAQRRDALRNPLIGSPQLRGSLEAVLNTFQGDRQREADAAAEIVACETRIHEAETQLDAARTAFAHAGRVTEKRRRMRAPLADALAYAADRRDEMEAEELRLISQTGART